MASSSLTRSQVLRVRSRFASLLVPFSSVLVLVDFYLLRAAAMPPNPAPAFPLADSPELIVEACSEINCPLTVHEIQHPTPAKVQAVYEAWMLKVLDINLEDCIKAAKDQLDHMDHYVRCYTRQQSQQETPFSV